MSDSQVTRILAMLKVKPCTNYALSKVSLRYSSVLHILRGKGNKITTTRFVRPDGKRSDTYIYTLEK